jgi:hypothetical protein
MGLSCWASIDGAEAKRGPEGGYSGKMGLVLSKARRREDDDCSLCDVFRDLDRVFRCRRGG